MLGPQDANIQAHSGHTVLLVEDEPAVRGFAAQVLRWLGCAVLEAGSGSQALALATAHTGDPIDLLVTDVVMPGMAGHELAQALRAGRPGLRVLYVSGYAAGVVVQQSVLEHDTAFLQKPFTMADLSRRVREMLDGEEPQAV